MVGGRRVPQARRGHKRRHVPVCSTESAVQFYQLLPYMDTSPSILLLYRVCSPVLSIITIYGHITLDSTPLLGDMFALGALLYQVCSRRHLPGQGEEWGMLRRGGISPVGQEFYQLLPYMDT
jgi:hypothetical protein